MSSGRKHQYIHDINLRPTIFFVSLFSSLPSPFVHPTTSLLTFLSLPLPPSHLSTSPRPTPLYSPLPTPSAPCLNPFLHPSQHPSSLPPGLLSESKGKELDDALGAAPMTAGPAGDVEYLRAEAIELNSNAALKEAILADLEPVSSTSPSLYPFFYFSLISISMSYEHF